MVRITDPPGGPNGTSLHALITGGAGFVGSHLAEALLERGYLVTVIDNLTTGRTANVEQLLGHARFRFVRDSMTNDIVMDRLANDCDIIFHLAAAVGVELIVRDPVRVIETNVLGTHAVLQVAARYGKKVVLASTSEVYGKNRQVPYGEDDDCLLGPTTKARWSYATSKAVDEFLALAYHRQVELPVVIFRLFNTVGPRQSGQYGMVLPRFAQQASRGDVLTVYGDGGQSRCFCDVADVVRAIVGLAESPRAIGRVFNIGSTTEVTILELAQRVLRIAGTLRAASLDHRPSSIADDKRIVFVPYDQAYEAGFEDMRRRVPNIDRIRATIGWEPRISLDETIGRVIAYHEEHSRPEPSQETRSG